MLTMDKCSTEGPEAQEPDMMPKTEIPILSFFTGAGFLDLGFKQSGFNAVWHNEYSSAFVSGFEHGMASLGFTGESAEIQSTHSILDIGPKEIIKSAFKGGAIPDCFGMIGGPPCPDFSVGGKNRGSTGENGRLGSGLITRISRLRRERWLTGRPWGIGHTGLRRAASL